ncbi:IQ domain-containing protein C [Aulostomus maculatus]
MDRRTLEKILTIFQARARGHLVRKELRRAREDFEDIVKEIDGGLSHLVWKETVISIPHFRDTDGPFLRARNSASKHSDPGLDVSASSQSTAAAPIAAPPLSQGGGRDHHLYPQKLEAEKDVSQIINQTLHSRDCFPTSPVTGDGERQMVSTSGVMESTGDSTTTIWNSLELVTHCSHSHKGPQKYCLAQEVPQTPEALRLHRDALTMELLWLQQAIDSRKKYLSLKDQLTVP